MLSPLTSHHFFVFFRRANLFTVAIFVFFLGFSFSYYMKSEIVWRNGYLLLFLVLTGRWGSVWLGLLRLVLISVFPLLLISPSPVVSLATFSILPIITILPPLAISVIVTVLSAIGAEKIVSVKTTDG